MNILKRNLLVNVLGDDYKEFLEKLYKTLNLHPDGCIDLVNELKSMFDVLSLPNPSPQANSSNTPYDYRFRYLLINNYRKFDKPKAQADYYGLSFCERNEKSQVNEIRNLFLLGGNGSGKSSLFNSMEYVFTGTIGEADYRGIKDVDWFVHRSMDAKPQAKVLTQQGTYDLDSTKFKEVTGLDVHRFFFSENSIYELSKYMMADNGNDQADWTPFFCYALGLDDVLGFLNGTYRCGKSDESVYDEVCKKLREINDYLYIDYAKERKKVETFISDACLVLTPDAADVIATFYENLKMLRNFQEKYSVREFVFKAKDIIPSDIQYIPSLNEFRNNIEKFDIQCRSERRRKLIDKKEGVLPNPFSNPTLSKEDVLPELENMIKSLKVILDHLHTNMIPFEQIRSKLDYLFNLESTQTFYGKNGDILHIPELFKRLSLFRTNLKNELLSIIRSYVDSEFINVVKKTLKDKFINDKSETLIFESKTAGLVFEEYGIDISVNGIPVNKYFNTFRFRLFTLCLLAAFNFKAMKEYNFRFPFVFDDIFYANDYRNKAELYIFFKVLEDVASLFLSDKKQLQVIFFTHDEQFMGTLRFNNDDFFADSNMARLLEKDLVKSVGGGDYVENDRNNECYLSLVQKIIR